MSADDRPRAADRALEERLRAAGGALREASAAQVDAATGLREIVHSARAAGGDPDPSPAGRPVDLAGDAPLPGPPRTRLLRASQRLALVVNLLLVVALSVVLVRVAGSRQDLAPAATATTVVPGTTVPAPAATLPPASAPATTPPAATVTTPRVPEECVDAAELADEIISRLTRNQRDTTLALDLRDYSVASQACRRAAAR